MLLFAIVDSLILFFSQQKNATVFVKAEGDDYLGLRYFY